MAIVSTDEILKAILEQPGITDRRLAEAILGAGTPQQRVNGYCRDLAAQGRILRKLRPDGLIGNFLVAEYTPQPDGVLLKLTPKRLQSQQLAELFLSEDELKRILERWLTAQGWTVEIAWARSPGIDLLARKDGKRWIIEAKGQGSLAPMRVNYFLGALGETLQRMDDPSATYSVAFPDVKQFRNLWSRLPQLARERTQISALFVTHDGQIELPA